MSFELLAWSFPFGGERLEKMIDALLAEDLESIVDLRECSDLWTSQIVEDIPLADVAFLHECLNRIRAGETPPQKPASLVPFTVCHRSIAPFICDVRLLFQVVPTQDSAEKRVIFPKPIEHIVKSAQLEVCDTREMGPRNAIRELSFNIASDNDRVQWVQKARLASILGSVSCSLNSTASGVRCWMRFASQI